MPTRLATWSDLLPASKILAEAFHDDHMFGRFVHPRQDDYPDDVHLYWLRFLREIYYTEPGEYLVTSYDDATSTGQDGSVTGIAHWIRNYSKAPPASWTSRLTLPVIARYNKAEDLVWKNRAIDHAKDAIIPLGNPFFLHHWSGSREDSWHLSLLGVSPAFGKRGYGRELVRWGFQRSFQESVSCTVISVPGQERFYRACGFDQVVGTTNDEGGDENAWKAAGLEPAPIMVCDHGTTPHGLKKYGEK
jgi:GNAT superfamily N-acetyltransferase